MTVKYEGGTERRRVWGKGSVIDMLTHVEIYDTTCSGWFTVFLFCQQETTQCGTTIFSTLLFPGYYVCLSVRMFLIKVYLHDPIFRSNMTGSSVSERLSLLGALLFPNLFPHRLCHIITSHTLRVILVSQWVRKRVTYKRCYASKNFMLSPAREMYKVVKDDKHL